MSTQPDALIFQETVIIEVPRPLCRQCRKEPRAIAALGKGKGLCWVCNGIRLRAAADSVGYMGAED